MRDLAVVGGGPVGLATALYAAQAGLDVVVLEPRAGTIDKACGEGLMPAGLNALRGLGVAPDGYPFRGIRYLAGRRSVTADFAAGPGLGVRRTTLHAALRQAVSDAGVQVLPHRVSSLEQDADGVEVEGVRARYLVAADGLHSPLRRSLGLDRRPRGRSRFGLRRHVRTAPWSEYVDVHWGDGVEAYVTPVAPDLVGVAVLTRLRGPFEQHLAAIPALQERLLSAEMTPAMGAGPLWQRSRRRVSGRVLLVGDASGYVDALTGEGIALGLQHAAAAVHAVLADHPGGYEPAWRRLTYPHAAMTQGLLTLTRPPLLRRALVPAAAALPGVFAAAVNALAAGPRQHSSV